MLSLTLKNPDDVGDAIHFITLAAFVEATAGWADLVRRLTLERSGSRAAIEWLISDLKIGSAELGLVDRVVDEERGPIVEEELQVLILDGMEAIELGASPTEVFSVEAAEGAIRMLGAFGSRSVGRILLGAGGRQLTLTREGAGRHVDQPAPDRRASHGSVEGSLKAISFSENRPFFSVYTERDGRAVKCYFDESRHLAQVLQLLRQRVQVAGRLHRRLDGSVAFVTEIKELRRLRDRSELPQIADIFGIAPDFTGPLPTVEWLRREGG